MSLKNTDHYYDCIGNPTLTSKQLFEQGERRVKHKKQALDDMQNEYELLQRQLFNLYKEHVYYNWCSAKNIIEGARNWLKMQKKKWMLMVISWMVEKIIQRKIITNI